MNNPPLALMCITAHPDDESLGFGPALARYAAEGIQTSIVCATRGQVGWAGAPEENPGPAALGTIREAELRAAARVLGASEVCLLGYMDGELDRAAPAEIIGKLVRHIRRVRPQVVITFDPFGAYGHPDHIAISQFTAAALIAAADPRVPAQTEEDTLPHSVSKFYYVADNAEMMAAYDTLEGELTIDVDGKTRHQVIWPDWAITAAIDAAEHWQTVWRAIQCHSSQKHLFDQLSDAPEATMRIICGKRTFYRAASLVNGGRTLETDLFEGLR